MENVLNEDLKLISESELNFEEFKNSTFLITGATGLIGSLLVKTLLYCNRVHKLNINVIALIRNKEKADLIFKEYVRDSALQYKIADLRCDNIIIESNIDYIVHAASVTASKVMVSKPVETIQTAVLGTEQVLKLAVTKSAKAVVYVSSMEIYGQPHIQGKVKENNLGFIDLSNHRSCYPEGKRMCECMCTSYAAEYGVNVMSARLAQTFGPGTLKGDNRVFAQFAKSVINGENIVLKTKGMSEGNYVYTRDAIKAILMLLIKGKMGEAYNISNEECHTTIREMAEMVARDIADNKINVIIDIPKESSSLGYAPDVKLWLDSGKMKELGWRAEVGLKESYERLIKWLELNKN